MGRRAAEIVRELLKEPGLAFRMMDVGASGGLPDHWQTLRDCIECVLVEPDESAAEKLRAEIGGRGLVIAKALASEPGAAILNLTHNPHCASVFTPNTDFLQKFREPERFEVVGQVPLVATTVDTELTGRAEANIDFIKIDTQGSERDILAGARQTITRGVIGIEVEVEFAPLYRGQPLFAEVDQFLRELGFYLFDLNTHAWRRTMAPLKGAYRGQLIWADALYLRREDSLAALLHEISDPEGRAAKLRHAVAIALIFGYPDYALSLLQAADAVAADRRKALETSVHRVIDAAPSIPQFRGHTRLAVLLRWMADRLSLHAHNSDGPGLGNRL